MPTSGLPTSPQGFQRPVVSLPPRVSNPSLRPIPSPVPSRPSGPTRAPPSASDSARGLGLAPQGSPTTTTPSPTPTSAFAEASSPTSPPRRPVADVVPPPLVGFHPHPAPADVRVELPMGSLAAQATVDPNDVEGQMKLVRPGSWVLLVKDMIFCLVKVALFTRLAVSLYPINTTVEPPVVTGFWQFFSSSGVGFIVMAFGDFVIINLLFLRVLFGVGVVLWHVHHRFEEPKKIKKLGRLPSTSTDSSSNHSHSPFGSSVGSPSAHSSSAEGEAAVGGREAPLFGVVPPAATAEAARVVVGLPTGQASKDDDTDDPTLNTSSPLWQVHSVYTHDWVHTMAYYSSFTYAVYWVHEFLTLKCFKVVFLLAREGNCHSKKKSCGGIAAKRWPFVILMLVFQVFKSLFAVFVIIFKLYFWSDAVDAVAKAGFSLSLDTMQAYITFIIVIFDILSLADMDYFILMGDFRLTRILQGQRDSMIDIIAFNMPLVWYLNDFVFKLNYVKLQHLIKMSFIAASKDLTRAHRKLLHSHRFLLGTPHIGLGRAQNPSGLPPTVFQEMVVVQTSPGTVLGTSIPSQAGAGPAPQSQTVMSASGQTISAIPPALQPAF